MTKPPSPKLPSYRSDPNRIIIHTHVFSIQHNNMLFDDFVTNDSEMPSRWTKGCTDKCSNIIVIL